MKLNKKSDAVWIEVSDLDPKEYTSLLEHIRIKMLTPIHIGSHGTTCRPGESEPRGHYSACFFRETAESVLEFLKELEERQSLAV